MNRHELQMHGRRIGVGRDYVDEHKDSLARVEEAKIEIPLCKNDLTINHPKQ